MIAWKETKRTRRLSQKRRKNFPTTESSHCPPLEGESELQAKVGMQKEKHHDSRTQEGMSRACGVAPLLEEKRQSSLHSQKRKPQSCRDGMGGFQKSLSLCFQQHQAALPPKEEKEKRPPHQFRMQTRCRLSNCQGGLEFWLAFSHLPTEKRSNHAHRRKDCEHRGAVAPVKQEVRHQARVDCLLEGGDPEVHVVVHRLVSSLKEGEGHGECGTRRRLRLRAQ
mmetsp:Transcript_49538/g.97532  ORF Transcript_49538/g.97532 Transcript_49538/m.97532 type:complete len:223 (+) Transcript_49538:1360-2028(+)